MRLFSFRGRAHRPKGAAKFKFGHLDNDYGADEGYHDDRSSTLRRSSEAERQPGGVIAADRRTACRARGDVPEKSQRHLVPRSRADVLR